MIQTEATVVAKETLGPAWWRIQVSAPALTPPSLPGQFLLVRCGNSTDVYLRRPIFPETGSGDGFSFLLRPDPDPGLAWLLTRRPGDTLDLIGPLGQEFPLPSHIRNLLLVSDTQAIGPLLGQMRRGLAAGLAVTLALGGRRAADLYPISALPPAVEFQAATLDGSLGRRGPVADLLPELLRWADLVCAAGSIELYRRLRVETAVVRFRAEREYLYGLVTNAPLACGTGACLGCPVETVAGLRLACLDGPVFDLTTLELAAR